MGKWLFATLMIFGLPTFAQTNLSDLVELKETADQAELEQQIQTGDVTLTALQKAVERHRPKSNSCTTSNSLSKKSETQLMLLVEIATRPEQTLSNENVDPTTSLETSLKDVNGATGKINLRLYNIATANFTDFTKDLEYSAKEYEQKLTAIKSGSVGFAGPAHAPKTPEQLNYHFQSDEDAQNLIKYVAPLHYLLAATFNTIKDTTKLEQYDAEIANGIASFIQTHYKSTEEKEIFKAYLNDLLYTQYNESKNPLANNSTNNPDRRKIPIGNVGITQLLYSVIMEDEYSGGVCNDYAAVDTQLNKIVFPERDNYALGAAGFGGSQHWASFSSDGRKVTVLAGQGLTQYDKNNGLSVWKDGDKSMNYRFANVGSKGEVGDLFVGKTSYGAFMSKITDPKNPYILQNTRDFSSQILKVQKSFAPNKKIEGGLGAAQINSQSKIVALFVNLTTEGKHVENRFSFATTTQPVDKGTLLRFHLENGYMIRKVLYRHPQVVIDGEIGSKAEIEAGVYITQPTTFKNVTLPSAAIPTYSGDIAFNTGIGIHSKSKSGNTILDISANESFQAGSSDYGGMTQTGFKEFMKRIRVFPNNTLAKVDFKHKINPKVSVGASAKYVGTAIGQDLTTQVGFSVIPQTDIEFSLFVGRTEKFGGTGRKGTKYNYLVNDPGGFRCAVGINTKPATVELEGKGIGTEDQMYKLKTSVIIPTKKKTKASKTQ